jgi:hypothetical protein
MMGKGGRNHDLDIVCGKIERLGFKPVFPGGGGTMGFLKTHVVDIKIAAPVEIIDYKFHRIYFLNANDRRISHISKPWRRRFIRNPGAPGERPKTFCLYVIRYRRDRSRFVFILIIRPKITIA